MVVGSCDSYLSSLVVEVPTSHKGGQFSWPQGRPRLVSSQSTLSACASSSLRVHGLRGGLLRLLLRDFILLAFFYQSPTRKKKAAFAKGCFSFLFLRIHAGGLRVSVEITLGWRRYCDSYLLSAHANVRRTGLSRRYVWFFGEFWACINFHCLL